MDFFNGLLQNLLANWLYELLVIVGGFGVGWARAKNYAWATPAMYGLVSAAMILIILIGVRAWNILPTPASQITPENLESNVRKWLDTFSISSRKGQDLNCYFVFLVTLRNGNRVIVCRVTDPNLSKYLIIQGSLSVTPPLDKILDGMSQEKKEHLINEVGCELAKLRMTCDILLASKAYGAQIQRPPAIIIVEKRVPINNNLSEDLFMDRLDDINSAIMVARQVIVSGLERFNRVGSHQLKS